MQRTYQIWEELAKHSTCRLSVQRTVEGERLRLAWRLTLDLPASLHHALTSQQAQAHANEKQGTKTMPTE